MPSPTSNNTDLVSKYSIKYLISINIFIYTYIYMHISDSYMKVITDDNPTFPENLLIKIIESIIKTWWKTWHNPLNDYKTYII